MIIPASDKLQYINEYYFSMKLREIKDMVEKGLPVINLGIGNPDMPPSEETIEALIKSSKAYNNHGYQSYIGTDELRNSLAEWYSRIYKVNLNYQVEILPLLGSKEGISHISQAFLNAEDIALVPDPGYPTYTSATRLAGGVPYTYSLDENNGWQPMLENIPEYILEKAKILWINYPNMPTGTAVNKSTFEKIISFAKKHKILIVNDNPYSLVLPDKKPVSIFQAEGAKEVCLELNSLSKSHNMAGWRVGMVAGSKEYIDAILKVKSNMDSGMFKPVQDAAITALSVSDDWHQKRNIEYASRREYIYEMLNILECTYSKKQVGMFIWAKISNKYSKAEDLTELLLHNYHIFITPGFIFGKNGEKYIRISLCNNKKVLAETVKRLQKFKL